MWFWVKAANVISTGVKTSQRKTLFLNTMETNKAPHVLKEHYLSSSGTKKDVLLL